MLTVFSSLYNFFYHILKNYIIVNADYTKIIPIPFES